MASNVRMLAYCMVCVASFSVICVEFVSDDGLAKLALGATAKMDRSKTEAELAFKPSPAWTTFWTGTDRKVMRMQHTEIGRWLVDNYLSNSEKRVVVLSLEVISVANFHENQYPNLQIVDDVRWNNDLILSETTTKFIRVHSTDGTFMHIQGLLRIVDKDGTLNEGLLHARRSYRFSDGTWSEIGFAYESIQLK